MHFGKLSAREANDPQSIKRGIVQELVDPADVDATLRHIVPLLLDGVRGRRTRAVAKTS